MTSLTAVSIARYRAEIRERMLRHKQVLAAVVLFVVPSFSALKALVVGPLAAIFVAPGTVTSVVSASGFMGVIVAWMHLQRDAVSDGIGAPLIMTLPFTHNQVLLRDIAVISLASSPWLLLLVLACALSLPDTNVMGSVCMCVNLLCAALVAQLGWVRRRYGWTFASGCVAILSVGAGTTAVTAVGTVALILLGVFLPPRRRILPLLRRSLRFATRRIRQNWLSLYARDLLHAGHGGYRQSLPALVLLAAVFASFFVLGTLSAAVSVGLIVVYVGMAAMLGSEGFATLLKGNEQYAALLDVIPTSALRREAAMIAAVHGVSFLLAISLGLLVVVGNRDAWPALCAPPGLAILGWTQLLVFRRSPRDAVAVTLATSCLFIGLGLWLVGRMA